MKHTLLLLFILLTCYSVVLPAQDTDFVKTVDSINSRLKRWAEDGASVYITAKTNGEINIHTRTDQFFLFNLFDLSAKDNHQVRIENGIELVPCDKKVRAPLAWINFYTLQSQVAFIRLNCNTTLSELGLIYKDFLHLKTLCIKK